MLQLLLEFHYRPSQNAEGENVQGLTKLFCIFIFLYWPLTLHDYIFNSRLPLLQGRWYLPNNLLEIGML